MITIIHLDKIKSESTTTTTITRVDDDPFANDGKTIDISDDDLTILID